MAQIKVSRVGRPAMPRRALPSALSHLSIRVPGDVTYSGRRGCIAGNPNFKWSQSTRAISAALACGAALLSPANAWSARATLRAKTTIASSVIRLGDVATIEEAEPDEAQRLESIVLTTAPIRGGVRYLRAAEIRDLAAAQGADLKNIPLVGGSAVEVRTDRRPPNAASTPQALHAISPAEVAALEGALNDYLERATGHALWDVELLTSDAPLDRVLNKPGPWRISGGRAPWSGKQTFHIVGPADESPIPLVARVARQQLAVVAVRPIERGDLVRATDVELRRIDGATPPQTLDDVESAIGLEARQAIGSGALVLANLLRPAVVVRRGEIVTVVARAAGIVVRTQGVARQDGSVGDLVPVGASDRGRREALTARVTGPRQLEVFAAEVSTDDYGDAQAVAHREGEARN